MDGIAFDMGHWLQDFEMGNEMDLLFSIEENEWNGRTTLQLSVKDIRKSLMPDSPLTSLEHPSFVSNSN